MSTQVPTKKDTDGTRRAYAAVSLLQLIGSGGIIIRNNLLVIHVALCS